MKYKISLFLFLLLSGFCLALAPETDLNKAPDRIKKLISNENDFTVLIEAISEGDKGWLSTVPDISEWITPEQSNRLMNALIHSLIMSPVETVHTLSMIDKQIAAKGHSPIRDKFGTDTVCAYMIDINRYNRPSFFQFYSKAKSQLEKTGDKGKICLEIMNASVEEVLYEEKKGNLKWGKERYPF